MCMGYVDRILGVSGVKTGRRRCFGLLGGGELETTRSGIGGWGFVARAFPIWCLWQAQLFWELRCRGFVMDGGYELVPV